MSTLTAVMSLALWLAAPSAPSLVAAAPSALAMAAQSSSPSRVTYFNGSQYSLHVYVAMAAQGATIMCNGSVRYQGALQRNASIQITIPAGQWAHIRFQRQADGGCDERNTQMVSQAVGNGGTETVNIQ